MTSLFKYPEPPSSRKLHKFKKKRKKRKRNDEQSVYQPRRKRRKTQRAKLSFKQFIGVGRSDASKNKIRKYEEYELEWTEKQIKKRMNSKKKRKKKKKKKKKGKRNIKRKKKNVPPELSESRIIDMCDEVLGENGDLSRDEKNIIRNIKNGVRGNPVNISQVKLHLLQLQQTFRNLCSKLGKCLTRKRNRSGFKYFDFLLNKTYYWILFGLFDLSATPKKQKFKKVETTMTVSIDQQTFEDVYRVPYPNFHDDRKYTFTLRAGYVEESGEAVFQLTFTPLDLAGKEIIETSFDGGEGDSSLQRRLLRQLDKETNNGEEAAVGSPNTQNNTARNPVVEEDEDELDDENEEETEDSSTRTYGGQTGYGFLYG